MKILAIDPATKTGWAHSNGESGVWNFSPKRDESTGIRFLKFRHALKQIYDRCGIDLFVYETSRGFGFWNALSMHAKFCGVIEEFCAEYHIQHKGYVSTAIKKHATLNGKAKKDEMISRAEFKWKDLQIISDDHADALWLLDLAKKDFQK